MKGHIYLLTAMAVSALLFSSCAKQSRLDIDSFKGSATVFGTAMYNAGDGFVSPSGESVIPAAGKIVTVSVPYSEYMSGNTEGYKTFSTTVAQDGSYRITVPVGNSPVRATVSMQPFQTDKCVLVNGETVVIHDAVYNSNTVSLTLEDQFIYEANLTATSDAYPENI